MNVGGSPQPTDYKKKNLWYRLSQLLGALLGARFFVTILLAFALYVSTFFLFNDEESLREFVFDVKVHGIIFCALLSILAGGIINQFYDREKDRLSQPFRFYYQSFLQQKYYLYAYIFLNAFSLSLAFILSSRVFLFFLVYQFVMWFYSHKLSKIIVINNITFVALTMYPFFGMLVYYETFSIKIFLMAMFLFFILLVIDVIKDTLTKRVDLQFGYSTLPNTLTPAGSNRVIISLLVICLGVSTLLAYRLGVERVLAHYFMAGWAVFFASIILILRKKPKYNFYALSLLRIWIFIGIVYMLLDGILTKI